MLPTSVYSSLLIAVLARTGYAAAIDSDFRSRGLPHLAVPGWANAAVNNVQTAAHNIGGTVSHAINSVPGSLLPGALVLNTQHCREIIQATNWDKYLGVAPVAQAVNKPCPWEHIMDGLNIWDRIKCGGTCIAAFAQENLNPLTDGACATCVGNVIMDALPCINAAGGFSHICAKATAIPELGPCLTGTADRPGICPKISVARLEGQ